jgi:hypothetical protein
MVSDGCRSARAAATQDGRSHRMRFDPDEAEEFGAIDNT